jgi:hypothetical protein
MKLVLELNGNQYLTIEYVGELDLKIGDKVLVDIPEEKLTIENKELNLKPFEITGIQCK